MLSIQAYLPCGTSGHIFQSLFDIKISLDIAVGPRFALRRAQSSPGYLQVGHVPSNCTRHMPQTSSSGISHRHDATAFHALITTFIVVGAAS